MKHLLHQSTRENGCRAVDEAPLESTFEQEQAELRGRQQFKRILKLVFLLVMTYPPYLWWTDLYTTTKLQTPNRAIVFPLHARFFFDTTSSVDDVSRVGQHFTPLSPGLKILGWRDMAQPETYYAGVHPLYNIAFFAEMYVGGKTYFMLIDTGSEVSWLFCEPPFVISEDNLTFAGPHGHYQPSLDHLVFYKDLHPPGFYACYQGGYLCKDIYYIGGLVVNVLMVKETFVMRQIDMSATSGNLVFGCGHSFTGPINVIKDGVDGVLGLMPKLFSLPCQLASTRAIRKVIGLCLKRYSNCHLQEVVGYLSFGDEVILVQEQMTWIKMINDAPTFGFAAAFLKSIQIGTFNHQFRPGCQGEQNARIIFDTGTTVTYLMPDIYDGLIQHLDKHAVYIGYKPLCGDAAKSLLNNGDRVKRLLESYKMCWYRFAPPSSSQNIDAFRDLNNMDFLWCNDFENLTFTFCNVDGNEFAQYQLEPLQYLNAYKVNDIDLKFGIICSLFLKHETKKFKPFNILGGLAFQGHLVVFDIDNKKIGWSTPKDCELLTLSGPSFQILNN